MEKSKGQQQGQKRQNPHQGPQKRQGPQNPPFRDSEKDQEGEDE